MHEQAINWWGLGAAYKESPALGWLIVTFVIFVMAMVYYIRKPLQLFLETRALDIEKAIFEAKIAKEHAEERTREYEERLKALDGEIERLKAEFMKQGEKEKLAFEKSAAELASQIAKEAEDNLGAEVRRALYSLKSEMADAIIQSAKLQLSKTHDIAAEESLKQVFTKGVRELSN